MTKADHKSEVKSQTASVEEQRVKNGMKFTGSINRERTCESAGLLNQLTRLRNQKIRIIAFAFCLFAFLPSLAVDAAAQGGWTATGPGEPTPPSSGQPLALKNVSIEQRLNEQIPLDLTFRDERGESVRLGDYFGKKPVVLSLVYYSCPQLCNQVLNGLTSSLMTLSAFSIGKEFEVVTVSFDARETAELAAEKKKPYIHWYKREGAAEGWHFLTGDQAAIDKLTEAVGFHYAYDAQTNQFAHASGIMMATPDGKLARYFYGVEYSAKDLRLGLVEASNNKIGSPVDQLLLYCYHYDPATGKYGPIVINMIRLGGIATIIAMIALVLIMRRRGPVQDRASAGGII
jgi:protein SCO1/2